MSDVKEPFGMPKEKVPTMAEVLDFFAQPFAPEDVQWLADGRRPKEGYVRTKVMPYVDARAVMDRFDDAVRQGLIEQWEVSYDTIDAGEMTISTYKGDRQQPLKGFLCTISILTKGTEVGGMYSRADGGEFTDFASVKGGISNSLRRAANAWGVGRYLYKLPFYYVNMDKYGKFDAPKLPLWALPKGYIEQHPEYGKAVSSTTNTESDGAVDAAAPFTDAPAPSAGGNKHIFKNGKHAGTAVEDLDDKGYLSWMADKSSFPEPWKAAAKARLAQLA